MIQEQQERYPKSSDNLYPGGTCVLSHFSRVQLFVTPWTVAHQVPLSMELSRQEYWSGLPCPPPGDLPHLGIEPKHPAFQTDSLHLRHQGSPKYYTGLAK